MKDVDDEVSLGACRQAFAESMGPRASLIWRTLRDGTRERSLNGDIPIASSYSRDLCCPGVIWTVLL